MCSLALVGCCVTCPQGDENKCLLTLERVLTIDQSQDTAKANSLTQRAFLGLLTGIWVKGYSQELKRLKDICITKAHPCVGDSSGKLGNLGHTAQPAGSVEDWRASLPGSCAALRVSLSSPSCLASLGSAKLVDLVSSRDFLKTLNCLLLGSLQTSI